MFACQYDGYESDSESPSELSQEDPDYVEHSKREAEDFENLMNNELDMVIFGPQTISAQSAAHVSKHVHFSDKTKVSIGGCQLCACVPTHTFSPLDDSVVDLTPEDLLYDEEEDDQNASWVMENLPGGNNRSSHAVLNCPSCMTVLSVNCSRNAQIKTHYDSMHFINCTVDKTNPLPAPEKRQQKRKKLPLDSGNSATETATDTIKTLSYAVSCEVCAIRVGTMDGASERVTFSNVLASHT